ncbi:MAG: T9SS type A sorting domain-containing protein [Taibaiella sp.]|nr:T9SS type A sorting domain-containing protein [Taibaiella sp.]
MANMKSIFRKLLVTACAAFAFSASRATIFTAIASGNFSSASTWGGLIPGSLISSDVVIIPSGIDVVLDADAVFSGSSSLMVNGSLVSSGSTALVVTSGALSGSGTIDVDSMSVGLSSGYSFTGMLYANDFTSVGANIGTAASIWVRNHLHLASGSLNLTDGNFTLYNNSMVTLSGGTIASSGTAMLHLDSVYSVVYTSASVTTGVELTGSGLDNVTVNLPGAVTMSGDLSVSGNLTLSSGTLALNGHELTIGMGGNLITTGSGMLAGSTTSDLTIMSTSSLTGMLTFTGSGNALHDLTLNMGSSSATASLGTSLTLAGTLNLQNGKLVLGSNDLHINTGGMLMGGSASSYVIADGSGKLMMTLAASSTDTFKVGTASHFSPVILHANSGSATGDVGVNVTGAVYTDGTTGALLSSSEAMVSSTWFVSTTATSAINYDMWVMWDASMEVNGFDRSNAYISHYTSGAWDSHMTSSAMASGSMYAISRTGITSLSPFMVTDNTFGSTRVTPVASNTGLSVYPNPVSNTLHFGSGGTVTSASIYNLAGKLVSTVSPVNNSLSVEALPKGFYTIRLSGADFYTTAKFVKE